MGMQVERDDSLAGKWYTYDEVLRVCLADRDFYEQSGGGVTLTGGEALAQAEAAIAILRLLQVEDIHTALETAGYAPRETFDAVMSHVDLLLYDIKHYDEAKHLAGTGVSNTLILQNLCRARDVGKEISIRIPVIPGYNDSLEDATGFADLLLSLGFTRVQLLPFHQFGARKYELLGIDYAYADAKSLYNEDLLAYQDVFIQAGIDCFF